MTLTWVMMSRIQMPATTMVIRVKVSPALEPNGLEPPTPPNAPARPPPLPRWISTRPIRNRLVRMTKRFRMPASMRFLPPRIRGRRETVSIGIRPLSEKVTSLPGRRPDDGQERVGLQYVPTDQGAVHVRLPHQAGGVVR